MHYSIVCIQTFVFIMTVWPYIVILFYHLRHWWCNTWLWLGAWNIIKQQSHQKRHGFKNVLSVMFRKPGSSKSPLLPSWVRLLCNARSDLVLSNTALCILLSKGGQKGYRGKNSWTYRDNSPSCRKKPKHESLINDRPADVLYYIEKHFQIPRNTFQNSSKAHAVTQAWAPHISTLVPRQFLDIKLAFFNKRHFLTSYQALYLVCFYWVNIFHNDRNSMERYRQFWTWLFVTPMVFSLMLSD